MTKKATVFKPYCEGYEKPLNPNAINQVVYKLSRPYKIPSANNPPDSTCYILISTAYVVGSGTETFVFSTDKDGEVTDWLEIWASRGDIPHADVLADLGYTLTAGVCTSCYQPLVNSKCTDCGAPQ